MRVAVVTPTIGSNYLTKCIDSVDKQTHLDLIHYIFVDGNAHYGQALDKIKKAHSIKLSFMNSDFSASSTIFLN